MFILFVTTTFLTYGQKLPSLVSLLLRKSLKRWQWQHSHSHIFLLSSHYCLTWTSAWSLSIIFFFLPCFHLWSIHFCKMSHGLITWRHGVSTMTCFAVCTWTSNTWVVTHHPKTVKEVKWLVADQNVHQLFM